MDSSQIITLGELESIGGDAYFKDSKITDIGKLKEIGGTIYADDSLEVQSKMEENKRKKTLNAQDIGKASYYASVEECDKAQNVLANLIEKEREEGRDSIE